MCWEYRDGVTIRQLPLIYERSQSRIGGATTYSNKAVLSVA